jgi:hypothetical protein
VMTHRASQPDTVLGMIELCVMRIPAIPNEDPRIGWKQAYSPNCQLQGQK